MSAIVLDTPKPQMMERILIINIWSILIIIIYINIIIIRWFSKEVGHSSGRFQKLEFGWENSSSRGQFWTLSPDFPSFFYNTSALSVLLSILQITIFMF